MDEAANKRQQVLNKFLQSLPKNISKLEEMWSHLRHVQWSTQVLASLKMSTHKLLGGALALRLHKIAYDLKSLEYNIQRIADDSASVDAQNATLIDESIDALKITVGNIDNHLPEAQTQHTHTPKTISDADKKLIYIVDDDHIVRDLLSSELSITGYQLKTYASLNELYDALTKATPSLVILDVVFPEEGALAGIEALTHLRTKLGFKVPVIFISARTDMVARLRCLRAGGNAFFAKPVDTTALIEKIEELTPKNNTRYKALLIDDDEMSLELHATLLEAANFEVEQVKNPLNAMREIIQTKPDVLILDMKMPMCNGMELADILRQDPQFSQLPIIFLTGDDSQATRERAAQVDLSYFLTKPVIADEFVDQALYFSRNFSKFKHKNLHQIKGSFGATLTRHEFFDRLDTLIRRSSEIANNIHLIFISLDEIELARNHFGIRNLDQINEQIVSHLLLQIKHQDFLTSITDGSILILHYGDFNDSWNTANNICEKLSHLYFDDTQNISASASIGLLGVDTSITNSIDGVSYTELAVDQARKNGGNQVVAVVSQPVSTIGKTQQLILSEKLEEAIKQKDYVLNFQSIVDQNDEHFLAYEVLVRLKDDMGREILPVKFVDIARNLEAIVEMDRWIYTSTTQTMHSNPSKLINARMFLKVSEETLSYRLIPTIIHGLIHESRILGDRQLVFMLDQITLENNLERAIVFAKAIHDIHCEIAIENYDFRQPFEILDKLKPGYIKIKGDVILSALKDRDLNIDLKAFLEFSRKKSIKIIASQIESESTIETCKKLGIHLFEGFLIHRPSKTLEYPKVVNG